MVLTMMRTVGMEKSGYISDLEIELRRLNHNMPHSFQIWLSMSKQIGKIIIISLLYAELCRYTDIKFYTFTWPFSLSTCLL